MASYLWRRPVGYNLITGQAATLTIADSILSNSVGGPDLVSDQPATITPFTTVSNAATAALNYLDQNIVPNVLVTAGVVNGMELDINPAWVSGTYFHHAGKGPAKGFSLFPAEQVPPQHYLYPASRDWYGWYARR